MTNRDGINIELTPTQFDYLYEVVMFAYEMDVPEQKEWDLQTFDNMLHLSLIHISEPTRPS
mgnify:CR=1 FL=1